MPIGSTVSDVYVSVTYYRFDMLGCVRKFNPEDDDDGMMGEKVKVKINIYVRHEDCNVKRRLTQKPNTG